MNHRIYRCLPSIQEIDDFLESHGKSSGRKVRSRVNKTLGYLRNSIAENTLEPVLTNAPSKQSILKWIAERLGEEQFVKKVINATGVVAHTNLGRAPLTSSMFENLMPRLSSYSSLEFDLKSGKRGFRDLRIRELLRNLSGAEEALLVNNNASAVLLMLKTLAEGREVLVSRGELVEIGGSFRIPDIIRESGAILVEVGTTNRTHLSDYINAITENTAAILKVHPSNYVIDGFTESVNVPNLVKIAKAHDMHCLHDWGSGTFYQFQQAGLSDYPTAQQEIQSGVDVLCFSADKLLGGVQGGILLGRMELLERMHQHPLYRALRVDKVTLGLMEEVLEAYFDPSDLFRKVPTIRLLERVIDTIREQAERVLNQLSVGEDSQWEVVLEETESQTGGGAFPEIPLPSCALVIAHPEVPAKQIQDWLRSQPLPVVVRISTGRVWLDFRTVFKEDESPLVDTLNLLFHSGLA